MMAFPVQASNEKLVTFSLKTARKRPGIIFSTALAAILVTVALPTIAREEASGTSEHEREELGVNQYTAPSIARVFEQLDQLKPLPFDRLKRELPTSTPIGREQQALLFGGLIADGFLVAEAKRQNLVETYGRLLLRDARGLGVGDEVTRHSASLTDKGKRGDWAGVRLELIATQSGVEQALISLRDEKMAHLISLGGWVRGLEICATAVAADFTPQRARVLAQPDLARYFAQELSTLPPTVIHTALFEKLRAAVNAISSLLDQNASSALTVNQVREIQKQAHLASETIRKTD